MINKYIPITFIFLLILIFRLPIEVLTNSDSLYLYSLARDILLKNANFWEWSLTPAPYLIPDFLLIILFYPLLSANWSIPIISLSHSLIILYCLNNFIKYYSSKNNLNYFWITILFFGSLISFYTYSLHSIFIPSMHGFSLYFGLWVGVWYIFNCNEEKNNLKRNISKGDKKKWRILDIVFVIGMSLLITQDRLFYLTFLIPLISTLLIFRKIISEYRKKVYVCIIIFVTSFIFLSIQRNFLVLENPGRVDFPNSFIFFRKFLLNDFNTENYFFVIWFSIFLMSVCFYLFLFFYQDFS
jgi:hypothetical protein